MSRFSPRGPIRPPEPTASNPKKRVLFVCLGNICRSPMAEALARKYGSDVLVAQSAGLSPAIVTTSVTRTVLRERNVDLGNHMPRSFDEIDLSGLDLIVNMSGMKIPPGVRVPVEDWAVTDPYGASESIYRKVCDDIESRVMRLILRFRTGKI